MSDPVLAALIIGLGGPAVLFGLNRVFGGRRKDLLAEWERWSTSQGERIQHLEERVGDLEKSLAEERRQSERKTILLRSVIRWALLLRDEVIRNDGLVPPAPPEVEAALTTLDP